MVEKGWTPADKDEEKGAEEAEEVNKTTRKSPGNGHSKESLKPTVPVKGGDRPSKN